MKRRRLTVVVVAAAAAIALGLSGCAGSSSGGRQTLSMWFWGASPAQQTSLNKILADGFAASQSKYTLKITYNNNVDKNVQTALAANQGPDIVYGSGPAFVSPYATADKIVDLDSYAEKYGWKDEVLDPIYQSGTVKGKLYALTTSLSSYGIFYNKKLLTDNGWPVPTTQAELISDMKAAQAKGLYASVTGNKGWQPVNLDYASLFLGSVAGPSTMYKALTGETSWTDPAIKSAIDATTDWYKKGYLGGTDYQNLNFDDSMSLLSKGKSPFFIAPTLAFQFASAYFNDKAGNTDNLGFVSFPNVSSELGAQVQTIGTVNSLSINASSKNKDGAAAVLNYILSSTFRDKITAVWPGYWGVPLKSSYEPSKFTGLSTQFATAINNTADAVAAGNYSFDAATFFPANTLQDFVNIDSVWLGKETSDAFLAKVDTDFAAELKKGTVSPIPKPSSAQ